MNKYILALLLFSQLLFAQGDKHSIFTKILNDYVVNGFVKYKDMNDDKRLDEYLNYLKQINPDNITDNNDKLAFWMNVYNAFTLKLIVDNYPVESINDLHTGGLIIGQILGKTVWHKEWININGKTLSLNNIEHDIIRKEFIEPRIHFALVCAALSCPPLRNEAYEGYKLEQQLENQATVFINNSTNNIFELKNKTAKLSKIFDWYESDFGDNDEAVLKYVLKYLPKETAKDINDYITQWDIEYLTYNWDLNESK